MRKLLSRGLALAAALGFSVSANAITIYLNLNLDGDAAPTPNVELDVTNGQEFFGTVFADVSGERPDQVSEDLQSYGVRMVFDSALASVDDIVSNPQWVLPETIEHVAGSNLISVFDGRLGGLSGNDVELFEVTFTALGNGRFAFPGALGLWDIFPDRDAFDGNVASDGFVFDGSVRYVPPVPIPAGIVLFVSAVVGLLGFARARRTSAA